MRQKLAVGSGFYLPGHRSYFIQGVTLARRFARLESAQHAMSKIIIFRNPACNKINDEILGYLD